MSAAVKITDPDDALDVLRCLAADRPEHARLLEAMIVGDTARMRKPSGGVTQAAFHDLLDDVEWVKGLVDGDFRGLYRGWCARAGRVKSNRETGRG